MSDDNTEKRLAGWIGASPFAMRCLRLVRDLDLPDWAIGAGFVRSLAWDRLSGFAASTPLADIDVLFFDPGDLSPHREAEAAAWLEAAWPGQGWSPRNQARMHAGNGDLGSRPLTKGSVTLCFCCLARREAESDVVHR